MKLFRISLILMVFLLSACELLNNPPADNSAKLICKGSFTVNAVSRDSVFFTEDNIQWFDTTSHQLRLKDSLTLKDVQTFRTFRFYLGTDSLFTARLALDVMSSIVDDLVFHFNYFDGKVYLEDGYPAWISDSMRTVNKQKRSVNWLRFINRLEKVQKIR